MFMGTFIGPGGNPRRYRSGICHTNCLCDALDPRLSTCSFVGFFLFATQTMYSLVGKTKFAALRRLLAVASRPQIASFRRALHRKREKRASVLRGCAACYCQKWVRGKPTPATSLPGRSISCWLFDPGEVNSHGCRAHLGDIGTAKPRGGRKSFLFTTAPHALYGTRACGPVFRGRNNCIEEAPYIRFRSSRS